MKRNDLGFATKVWLTGVLIPSVFWVFTGDFVVWAIAIFYSAAFSIPSWLLLWLGVVFLNRQSWDVGIKKVVCCILSLPLTVGAFMLLKVNFGDDLFGLLNNFQLFVILVYLASICWGIMFFDLEGYISEDPDEMLSQMPESQPDTNN